MKQLSTAQAYLVVTTAKIGQEEAMSALGSRDWDSTPTHNHSHRPGGARNSATLELVDNQLELVAELVRN